MSSMKTIHDELQRLDLPETIRALANDIYARLASDTGTRRCSVRRGLIFFCVYNGYLEAGEVRDPVEIATLVGINPNTIAHALKQFSYPLTCYRIKNVTTSPLDLIEQYAFQQGIREDLMPDLKALCARWTSAPVFRRLLPQPVAAGVLRYYMELNGLSIDMDTFLKTYHLTRLALDKAYTHIVELDNA